MSDNKENRDALIAKYRKYYNKVSMLINANFVERIEISVGDYKPVPECKDGITYKGEEFHLYKNEADGKLCFFYVDEESGLTKCLYHNEFTNKDMKEIYKTRIIHDYMSGKTFGEVVTGFVLIFLLGYLMGGGIYIIMAFGIFIPFLYLYLRFKRLNSKIDYLIEISDLEE